VNRLKLGLDQRPEHIDLADIVNQSEQYPLYIHFALGAQSEAVHVFMHADVRKDRLDNREPPRIDLLALLAVDLGFHQIDQVRLGGIELNGKISARSVRLAQTARAQRTDGTVFGAGVIDIIRAVTVDLVVRMTLQLFSVRTEIDALAFIISKISRAERTGLGICILLLFETLLIGKARIALAELDIGNICVHLFLFTDRQTVQRMIVTIGGEFFALEVVWILANRNHILFRAVQHRLEVFMILAGECLRGEDHLMFGIDQRLRIVSLNDPM
jgi:hypothetical protein